MLTHFRNREKMTNPETLVILEKEPVGIINKTPAKNLTKDTPGKAEKCVEYVQCAIS